MKAHRRNVVNCPHCGEENEATESRCRACSKGLTVYIGPAHVLPRRFGLGPIMILVAVVALGLGVWRASPPSGMLILVLLTPAVIRTTAVVSQQAADGRPTLLDDKVFTFFSSVGVMLVVLIVSGLTSATIWLLVAALALGWQQYGLQLAVIMAGAGAIFTGYLTLRKLWPYRG